MNKFIASAALFALLSSASTIAIAAEGEVKVACNDGTMDPAGKDACSKHGGMWRASSASADTKGKKTVATKKTKTSTTATSSTTRKKTSSKATRDPTAKCMDGALYFSKERRGACATHGGVDRWYGT